MENLPVILLYYTKSHPFRETCWANSISSWKNVMTEKLIYIFINNDYIPKWIYKLIAVLLE